MNRIILAVGILLCSMFTNAQTYFLNGTAQYIGNDCYRLTQTIGNQNGTVWYAEQIDLSEPFNIEFEIYLGLSDAGADGIVFVLQTVGTDAIGDSGGGIGYEGFSPSLGIEFDTWQNLELADIAADHIAVISNGVVNHSLGTNIAGPVQTDIGDVNVEDGSYHSVRIIWEPITQNLQVLFDCEERINTTYDIIGNIFSGDPMVFWGFTGSTGGANNNQIVCLQDNILSVGPNVTICTGSSTTLDIPGDPEGTFTWTPAAGLDDPSIGSPNASPDSTTTYTVQYSDLCGAILIDSVTVTVQDLIVTIDDFPLLSCEESVQTIQASNNFDNEVVYSWDTDTGDIIANGDSDQPSVGGPGWYYVEASFNDVCFSYDSVMVEGNYEFSLELDVESIISCFDPTTTISGITNPDNGAMYVWETGAGTIDAGQGTDQITVSDGGTYTLSAFINDFCISEETINVPVNFETSLAEAGNEQQIDCDTPTITLSGSTDGSNPDIFWTTSDGNLFAGVTTLSPSADETGTYTITATHPVSGCTSEDTVNVIANFELPLAEAGTADTLTCQDPWINITGAALGGQNPSFTWSTSNGNILENGNTLSPLVDQPGTYLITVVDNNNGCISTDEVVVFVNENFFLDVSSMTIPNIITPGGDDYNDVFKPFLKSDPEFELTEILQDYSLQIYNRWGVLLYENESNETIWDGRISGEFLPDGTYYYIMTYSMACSIQEESTATGHIQVINTK
ncbi:MAG: gliding motility-associated-like protein [Flavobacteriales bacterium]|jgi:gliding motility-associated-like protein